MWSGSLAEKTIDGLDGFYGLLSILYVHVLVLLYEDKMNYIWFASAIVHEMAPLR